MKIFLLFRFLDKLYNIDHFFCVVIKEITFSVVPKLNVVQFCPNQSERKTKINFMLINK